MGVDCRPPRGSPVVCRRPPVGGEVETPLERLQGVGPRLVRPYVEQSGGEFSLDLEGDHPVVEIRFPTPEG